MRGYENPDDRPVRDYAYYKFHTAWSRLFHGKPIPITEMIAYHQAFDMPHSLEVFVEVIQGLEHDYWQSKSKEAKPKKK